MYSHLGFGFAFPGLGLLLVILFGALIVIGIALLIRRPAPPPVAAPPVDQRSQAQRILEERFARGEIDEAEFRARLEVLLGATWAPAGVAATPASEPVWVPAPAQATAPPGAATTSQNTQPGAATDEGADR
jgi:putative membrane protein